MKNLDIKEIVNTILTWGVGGVLMVLGACMIVFNKQLGIDWPYFLWGGLSIMIVGMVVYISMTIMNYKVKVYKLSKGIEEKKGIDNNGKSANSK